MIGWKRKPGCREGNHAWHTIAAFFNKAERCQVCRVWKNEDAAWEVEFELAWWGEIERRALADHKRASK